MNRIYWRSKEGKSAPKDAQFFLQPFEGTASFLPSERIALLPSPSGPIKAIRRVDLPTKDAWGKVVEKALILIDQKILQKVVLARRTTLTFDAPIDPLQIVAALEKKSEGASLFCIDTGAFAFLGASPERLFRREAKNLFVDALAGTKKKGEKFSEKEVREWGFVENYLRASTLCNEFAWTPRGIHQTANLQHLYAQGKGVLKSEISDLEILKTLHPTPALCGTPQKTAFGWIAALEPFRRGLYGGVIGWSSETEADTTVCIRCCMIEGASVHFYTGVGIVEGSDPDGEWEELELKLSLYEGIFDHRPTDPARRY